MAKFWDEKQQHLKLLNTSLFKFFFYPVQDAEMFLEHLDMIGSVDKVVCSL